jgi:hypothetical protein
MTQSPLFPAILLAAIGASSWTATTRAAPTHAEAPLSESLHGAAKDAYKSAELLFNNGDFRGSITKYQQAYDLSKDPRLLFDMALAEKNLRSYARMQRLLERYEREVGPSISAEDRSAVDGALAAIKNLVGTVTVTTNVPGATIAIDDDVVGTTPLAEPVAVDLGRHKLTARKEGFDTATMTFDVAGGTRTIETLTLTVQVHTAQLLVAAEPGSIIVIDGKTTAEERFDGRVSAGTHQVGVTAPGKVPYKTEVELHERETRTLQVTLADERNGSAVWPWIVGGTVAAVGLGVGGYFLFRPHDQTTPVPAGPLFNVSFSSWRR